MKSILQALCVALWVLSGASALACTAFLMQEGDQRLVAKSYDWDQDQGLVLINKRGVQKQALVLDPRDSPARWTSRYASLTFNQYGREMPNGGLNEAGLVMEILWLKQTGWPRRDQRPALNELQLIQYALDNFGSVQELKEKIGQLRVAPAYAKVHYFTCDATGACATLEFLDGELVIHAGDALLAPALANHSYADSRAFLKRHEGFGGSHQAPGGQGSLARFTRAASLSAKGPASDAAAFRVLDEVSMGDYSKWNIVYDPVHKQVWFRTRRSPQIKHLKLGSFAPGCDQPVMMMDINATQGGDADKRMQPYSTGANLVLLQETLAPMRSSLPAGVEALLARYPEALRCQASTP